MNIVRVTGACGTRYGPYEELVEYDKMPYARRSQISDNPSDDGLSSGSCYIAQGEHPDFPPELRHPRYENFHRVVHTSHGAITLWWSRR